jgi:uncharacterized iron-regulated membrane protein
MATPAFWRKWHRWIGFPAALFLLFSSITGVSVAVSEFFGEAEAQREATRDLVSPVRVGEAANAASDPLSRALASARDAAPGAPIDKIVMQFKGDRPTVEIFTGKPEGGEDRRLIFDARTGGLLRQDAYVDKPLLHRIHSGEAFGDGGLVFAMLWGVAMAILTATGFWIYLTMRRPNQVGLRKVFW